jgi:hypothetical protein
VPSVRSCGRSIFLVGVVSIFDLVDRAADVAACVVFFSLVVFAASVAATYVGTVGLEAGTTTWFRTARS